jgi:hypothetical protein
MMGFRAAVCAITQAPFGEGMGPIWMDNLQCSGRETRLDECAFNGWGVHSCDHSKDAGAICATGMAKFHIRVTNFMSKALKHTVIVWPRSQAPLCSQVTKAVMQGGNEAIL